jgi:hypothetical protein
MQRKQLTAILVAAALGAAAGCGSSNTEPTRSGPTNAQLGGAAPTALVGTFKTTLTRRDVARAPIPNELPLGPWTLVIGNSAGPGHTRALGVGNGDYDRVVYRLGVNGNRVLLGCNNDQGLPSDGSETYIWSLRGERLTLKPVSPACKHGDPNNQLILTSHPWTRQSVG